MTMQIQKDSIAFVELCSGMANGKVTAEEIVMLEEGGVYINWYPCINGKAVLPREGGNIYPTKADALSAAWEFQEKIRARIDGVEQ